MAGPTIFDLEAALNQQKIEIETLQEVNTGLVMEGLALKHKIVDMKNEAKELKEFLKALKSGNK